MFTPVTSDGSMSDVNWIRLTDPPDRRPERLREHGLADAGDVLDEQVALGEHDGEGRADRVGLAVHHGRDRRGDGRPGFLDHVDRDGSVGQVRHAGLLATGSMCGDATPAR
ncbi:hypothetical protein [Curtobacterium sp. MCJR17_043]|uniref:hypothetical protein n=1 Tax=Curtobacterium sp. MCJR17_043 TaxID=2175660 RepID=UPI0024DFC1FA|nr:hypothetical protein [Curtobacterium sp. MCJR17_043]WIB37207.1 hypothetical protein DEJ15_15345 [Curtobacterium sp. MCJR17_043]